MTFQGPHLPTKLSNVGNYVTSWCHLDFAKPYADLASRSHSVKRKRWNAPNRDPFSRSSSERLFPIPRSPRQCCKVRQLSGLHFSSPLCNRESVYSLFLRWCRRVIFSHHIVGKIRVYDNHTGVNSKKIKKKNPKAWFYNRVLILGLHNNCVVLDK